MMLRTLPRSSRRAAGFTLIELLVAVALLAILAVLSWRGLDAVIQSRERLVTESDELRSLTLALAQLEEDLLGTWPVKNLGGGIRPIRVVQDQGGAGGAGGSYIAPSVSDGAIASAENAPQWMHDRGNGSVTVTFCEAQPNRFSH